MSKTSSTSKNIKRTVSSKQRVKDLLKKCEIDPSKPGIWQTVAESAGAEYLEHRAAEELNRAIQCLKTVNAPALQDYQMYEQHMVQATELLTLARLKRKTYLLDNDKYHVVIVTQMGIEEGSSTATLEDRRMVACKAKGEKYVPMHGPSAKLKAMAVELMVRLPATEYTLHNPKTVGETVSFPYQQDGYTVNVVFVEESGLLYTQCDGIIRGQPGCSLEITASNMSIALPDLRQAIKDAIIAQAKRQREEADKKDAATKQALSVSFAEGELRCDQCGHEQKEHNSKGCSVCTCPVTANGYKVTINGPTKT